MLFRSPVSGLSWCYAGLPRHLGPEVPVYGLQARGISAPARLPADLDELVDDYLGEIRARQPHGPYRLLGWSLGGNIAQAIAARLRRSGEQVSELVLLDSYPAYTWEDTAAPESRPENDEDVLVAVLAEFGIDLRAAPERLMGAEDLRDRARAAIRDAGATGAGLDEGRLAALAAAAVHNVRLVRQVRPDTFDGPVLFFTAARSDAGGARSAALWQSHLTGSVEEHRIDCTHEEITAAAPLARIGETLRARLHAATY